jgi:molybdate transport system permease protein
VTVELPPASPNAPRPRRRPSNAIFVTLLALAAAIYPVFLVTIFVSSAAFPRGVTMWTPWQDPALRHAAGLSLWTSLLAATLSLGLAVPCGYVLSRYRVPGWRLLDIVLYLPIVLPPLVVGVSLLIFFQTPVGKLIEHSLFRFTFAVPGIVLAQTLVGAGFATRIAKLAFDGVSRKQAGVARTLGATRWQAFWRIELAEARRGLCARVGDCVRIVRPGDAVMRDDAVSYGGAEHFDLSGILDR